MNPRRGLSLVETIVALFLITGIILVVLQLLTRGIQANSEAERSQRAALVAERRIGEVRRWAQTPGNFYGGSWTTIASGSAAPDPAEPAFQVTVQALAESLYSPCTLDEARYPLTNRRALLASFRKLQVDVSWDDGSPRNRMTLCTLVGAPPVPIHHLDWTPGAGVSLAHDQTAPLNVTAVDEAGNAVPDHFFDWTLQGQTAQPSMGSFQNMTRTGVTGQYDNFFMAANIGGATTPVYGPPGNVSLGVRGRSVSILDTAAGRFVVNTSAHQTVENL